MFYTDVILADNPSYYLPLDVLPVTNRGSGTNNINTGTSLSLDGAGIGDAVASVEFDGASAGNQEFVRIHNLLSGTRNSLSVELWVKGTVKNSNPRLLYFYNAQSWLNLQMDNRGRPSAVFGGYPSTYVTASSTKDVQDGEWHHLAVVADVSTRTLRLYVDGDLADTKTGFSTSGSTNAPLWIGQSGVSGTLADGLTERIYDGVMSQFALYLGAVLSADSVKAHYNAGMGIGPPAPPEAETVRTDEHAESLWTGLKASLTLAESVPVPQTLRTGTHAQTTFYGMRARMALSTPTAEQLTLLAGEQAGTIWEALEAQIGLTEPVFVPVGEWQLTASMPSGQVITRLNTNQIEAVMAPKVLWPTLKEEA